MHRFSAERLAAYTKLLRKRDLTDPSPDGKPDIFDNFALLRGKAPRSRRGHRQTCAGSPDRMRTTWLRAAQGWTQLRLATSDGVLNGWKSARTHRSRRDRVVMLRRG